MANWPNTTGTPQRMNAPYVTSPTHAPTMQASAMLTRTFPLATTTQHAGSYKLQTATLPKGSGHSMVQKTSA